MQKVDRNKYNMDFCSLIESIDANPRTVFNPCKGLTLIIIYLNSYDQQWDFIFI